MCRHCWSSSKLHSPSLRVCDDPLRALPQNSAHFKNEQRKQAQTEQRIVRMQARAVRLTPGELAGFTKCGLPILGFDFCFFTAPAWPHAFLQRPCMQTHDEQGWVVVLQGTSDNCLTAQSARVAVGFVVLGPWWAG